MQDETGAKFWRVRMRYSPETDRPNDYSKTAWSLGQVGIWYGAWSVNDYREIRTKAKHNDLIAECLNQIPLQQELGEKARVREVHTIRRFFGDWEEAGEEAGKKTVMSANDWVVVCADEEEDKVISLGRLQGEPRDEENHNLNMAPPKKLVKERWKFREVTDQKSFPISALPDFYRLIPQYGRSNIFQFHGNYLEAVRILAKCKNVFEVQEEFRAMTYGQRLNLMGPEVWEALCLGYLIRMRNFVPTGVSVGRTLKDFDMVGSDWNNEKKIYAQCKKDQDPKDVEVRFYAAAADAKRLNPTAIVYYFPYGDCVAPPPVGVIDEVINRRKIEEWFRTKEGDRYLRLFWAC